MRIEANKTCFQDFIPVQAPAKIRALPDFGGGVREIRHAGGLARVTSLERTLVDVLDAPDNCGGREEVWRSREMVEGYAPLRLSFQLNILRA